MEGGRQDDVNRNVDAVVRVIGLLARNGMIDLGAPLVANVARGGGLGGGLLGLPLGNRVEDYDDSVSSERNGSQDLGNENHGNNGNNDNNGNDSNNGNIDTEEEASINRAAGALAILNGTSQEPNRSSLGLNLEPDFYENQELLSKLLGNLQVHSVNFWVREEQATDFDSSLLQTSNDQPYVGIRKLLIAVATLPNLVEVCWETTNSRQVHLDIPASFIAYVLSFAPHKLQRLYVSNLRVTGTLDEFKNLGVALKKCKTLNYVSIVELRLPELFALDDDEEEINTNANVIPVDDPNATRTNLILAQLLNDFAELPNLRDFGLRSKSWQSLGRLDVTSMTRLLQNPKVKNMVLDYFSIDEAASAILARARSGMTETFETIEMSVCCHGAFSASVTRSISAALEENVPLQELRFNMDDCDESVLDGQEPEEIAIFLDALSRALRTNTTLRKFDFLGPEEQSRDLLPSQSKRLWKQFVEAMETNTSLRRFDVDTIIGEGEELQAKLEYYVKLNSNGRGRFVRARHADNKTEVLGKRDWVEHLGKCSKDLDCLFYFLCANPTLCDPPAPPRSSRKRKRQRASLPGRVER
ncbi:expressed unknown protein [Seminavis robusta]|uniref:Uncharacterized protein n=1 Tax=Seminavis robusta TaxID=568900 RepID=A0A9N8EQJ1_9STRA|nr:expressed unknown protein [Seminavis robusta]|eukprot:Sro1557_g282230.1 n/a (585) ;mRNA; f:3232-4986